MGSGPYSNVAGKYFAQKDETLVNLSIHVADPAIARARCS